MLGPRELTGKILSLFYISQLPANMLFLGFSLSCRLTEQDRWDNAPYVYEQCIFTIAQMHERTAAPAVMVPINLAGEVVIPIIPVAVAEYKRDKRDRSGAGKSGGGGGGGGRRRRRRSGQTSSGATNREATAGQDVREGLQPHRPVLARPGHLGPATDGRL